MEKTLFSENGEAVAYVVDDYDKTIYLWDGSAVAYLYDDKHIYGINGRHLGWFTDEILYNYDGERIGFTSRTCPVSIAQEPLKSKKQPVHQIRPRWSAPPFPKLGFDFASEGLADFLKEGEATWFRERSSSEESQG